MRVALKLYEKVEPIENVQEVMNDIAVFNGISLTELNEAAKEIMNFAKMFKKMCPNFHNLRKEYADVLSLTGFSTLYY